MSIKKHIPNFITCLNLFSGTMSVFAAFHGLLAEAALLLFASAIFDFFDGFAARMLKAYSPMGKDLDSLADMVSFGLAPMVMLHMMVKFVLLGSFDADFFEQATGVQALIILPFVGTVFSGLRLAKFNVDTRQSESFIGLTTTATGMFLASLAFVFVKGDGWLFDSLHNQWVLLSFVPLFSFLLVSEIPMFSLKFKTFGVKGNADKYILLAASLFFLVWVGFGGIAITIALYVLFSLIKLLAKR